MKVSEIEYKNLSNDVVDKIIFDGILDDGLDGDCILVFGGLAPNRYRVPKAVELYNSGRSQKLLMSGGNELEVNGKYTSEGILMKAKAIELGVRLEDIIIETFSRSTKENILSSLIPLDRVLGLNNIKNILLVTTLYHMRRCNLMAKTYMPNWIQFSMCPAYDLNTLRYNWFLNKKGAERAKNEAYKIISYVKEGSLPDFII